MNNKRYKVIMNNFKDGIIIRDDELLKVLKGIENKSIIITREGIINPSFFIAIVADYERMKIVDNGFSNEPSPFAELLSGKMEMLPNPCQSPQEK